MSKQNTIINYLKLLLKTNFPLRALIWLVHHLHEHCRFITFLKTEKKIWLKKSRNHEDFMKLGENTLTLKKREAEIMSKGQKEREKLMGHILLFEYTFCALSDVGFLHRQITKKKSTWRRALASHLQNHFPPNTFPSVAHAPPGYSFECTLYSSPLNYYQFKYYQTLTPILLLLLPWTRMLFGVPRCIVHYLGPPSW